MWYCDITCFIGRDLQKHAAVGPAFVGLSGRMQESWTEAKTSGDMLAVANRVPERLQQRLVLRIHLNIGKNGEVIACAEAR